MILGALLLAQAAAAIAPPPAIGSSGLDPVTITLIGGQVVLIITTLGGVILAIITHLRVTTVKEQQAVNTASIVTVAKDTEAIKGHVNSEKTASEGREVALRQENSLLREMLTHEKNNASLLAQAAAVRTRGEGKPGAGPGTPASDAGPLKVEVVNTPLAVEIPT
jgi:hypothetical protein